MSDSYSLEFSKLGRLRSISLKGLVGERLAQRSIIASKKRKEKEFCAEISGRKGIRDIPGLGVRVGGVFFLFRARDLAEETKQLSWTECEKVGWNYKRD